jgi:hypothetical protein
MSEAVCALGRFVLKTFSSVDSEVAGEWKKIHSKELHNECSSLSIFRIIRTGHVARLAETRNENILVGNIEVKRPVA